MAIPPNILVARVGGMKTTTTFFFLAFLDMYAIMKIKIIIHGDQRSVGVVPN